ncbi:hypothetical protein L2E82_01089 [Cichorium intybus]|uniref:Uncharacterized protein n=1 Tax=Cichorium intybus TaxID=13427 RepID=A0ACB9GZ23_CICIN|nr:hypothetical protein L2E82_01089 [Cichorium intybus]
MRLIKSLEIFGKMKRMWQIWHLLFLKRACSFSVYEEYGFLTLIDVLKKSFRKGEKSTAPELGSWVLMFLFSRNLTKGEGYTGGLHETVQGSGIINSTNKQLMLQECKLEQTIKHWTAFLMRLIH